MLAALVLGAAATLVVPWFEVSVEKENRNFDTRFTIENASDEAQKARINVWTDRGTPVLYYTTLVEPHAKKTVSMRELLVDGMADICAHGGPVRIPIRLQEQVRCSLTTGCKVELWDETKCVAIVGDRHAHAIGYVTIDAVSDCMDLSSPETPQYAAQVRKDQAFTGTFEQMGNGRVIHSGALIEGGAPKKFHKPRSPRDPLAKTPPRKCPPFSPPEPQV